jgi:hypothetical protein
LIVSKRIMVGSYDNGSSGLVRWLNIQTRWGKDIVGVAQEGLQIRCDINTVIVDVSAWTE